MQGLLNRHLLTGLVLIASLAVSYGLWNNVQLSAERELQNQFEYHAREIIAHVQQRMDGYQAILYGVRALFNGSEEVTRGEFHTYVTSLQLDEHYPGIQGLSHAPLVKHAQKAEHIAAVRGQGFPDYTISPAGEREQYTPVLYIEPFTDRNKKVLGYDTFSESMRHNTMMRAQDNDRAAASGKLTLVQEAEEDVQAGFLVFLPLYKHGMPHSSVAERRAGIDGWVTAVFRMGDLMAGLGHEHSPELGLSIHDLNTSKSIQSAVSSVIARG
jgi:CHASE1-domain containing sensor protein